MTYPRRDRSAFTLTELLIVIVIIVLLAALLLPAVYKAREKGRQANCMSNLHQFSLSLTLYGDDHQEQLPPWLSALCPKYIPTGRDKTYVCKSDSSHGTAGSKPDADDYATAANDPYQYPETDDTDTNNDPANTNRPSAITACSYMYECCAAKCGWSGWQDYVGNGAVQKVKVEDVDKNGDNEASWGEVKDYQFRHGDSSDTGCQTGGPKPYDGTVFPIVRCFHHYKERKFDVIDKGSPVKQCMTINIAHAGNVFQAPLFWELLGGK